MLFRSINVLMAANVRGFQAQVAQAGRTVDAFGKKVETTNQKVQRASVLSSKAFKVTSAAILIAALALVRFTTQAISFEREMRNVATISETVRKDFRGMGAEVIQLSRELPQTANELARGLYDIASSGFAGRDGLVVLRSAAEAASAGLSTTATAARAITAILNAYGRSATDAGDVSDVLFQTVNLGVITFEELANSVGDFIGTAAAAKIPVEDTGAAIAAMTLAGLNASEAGVSLNRVIQGIIQPSKELSLALRRLGYESGAQALETDGLRGIMERLRISTGGNVTALLALFPEIRAARGAFALMANEGRNYERVSNEIADSERRQGATKRALEQQMLALGNRIQLLRNRFNAWAVEIGLRVIPTVNKVLTGVIQLGRALGEKLRPFLTAVGAHAKNLVIINRDLYRSLEPVIRLLGTIVGGAILGTLTAFAKALQSLTSFLSEHRVLVGSVAVLYAASLVPGLLKATKAFLDLVQTGIRVYFLEGAAAAKKAALAIASVNVASAGIAAGLALVGFLAVAWQEAKRKADEYVKALDTPDFQELHAEIAATADRLDELARSQSLNVFATAWESMQQKARQNALLDELEKIDKKNLQVADNIQKVAIATGMSRDQIISFAKRMDFDLTATGKKAQEVRDQMVQAFKDEAAEAGITQEGISAAVGIIAEDQEKFLEAVQKGVEGASSAFRKAFDIVSDFKGLQAATAEEIADAQDEVFEATERVKKAEEEHGAQSREVARERRNLAEAERDLADRTKTTAQRIKEFYGESVTAAKSFTDNIEQSIRRGLDPNVIARLLEAGPKEAAPLLEAIVSDSTGRLIQMVNEGEKALEEINTRVVMMARLTHQAIAADTDALARQLPEAMRVVQFLMSQEAEVTTQMVAEALKLDEGQVAEIARNFGLTGIISVREFRKQVEEESRNFPIPVPRPGRMVAVQHGAVMPSIAKSATVLYGERGTGGEAFIPMGSQHRGRSSQILGTVASQFGYGLVRMQGGGMLPAGAGMGAGSGGDPRVVVVERDSSRSTSHSYSFTGDIHAGDMAGVLAFVDRKKRLRNLTGS